MYRKLTAPQRGSCSIPRSSKRLRTGSNCRTTTFASRPYTWPLPGRRWNDSCWNWWGILPDSDPSFSRCTPWHLKCLVAFPYNHYIPKERAMEENTAGAINDSPAVLNSEERAAQAETITPETEVAPKVLPAVETYTVIKNETDAFIGITSKREGYSELIIAPFGSRTVNSSWLPDCYYEAWLEQKLISIYPLDTTENDSGDVAAGLLIIVLGIFLVVSIPVNLFLHSISWPVIGI